MEKLSKQELKRICRYKMKKYREQDHCFLAEGTKIVGELIHSSIHIEKLVFSKTWLSKNNTVLEYSDIQLQCDDKEFEKISNQKSPEGILAVCSIPNAGELAYSGWSLVVDKINNPGNLGTIIRLADWFGIKELICSEETVDAYSPKVIQSSMGSIARVTIHYKNLVTYLSTQNRKKYGASLEGNNILEHSFSDSGILIIGSESHGISPKVHSLLNEQITYPKMGEAESLNAAVATGIILSHIMPQAYKSPS